jgi:phage recombination protein Bet
MKTENVESRLATAQAPSSSRPSALAAMAGRMNVEPNKLLSTLKNTVFKGASDDELLALVVVANEYNLNPLTKQIYAFPNKGGGIVPVVSVDGWMRVINEHPQMDGIEFEFHNDANGDMEAVTCIIYRKDRTRPTKVTEYLAECRRNTEPWKMTHRMLRHKALIQCARVAFGLSGIFDEDEAERIRGASAMVIESKPLLEMPRSEKQAVSAESEPEPDQPSGAADEFIADTPQKKILINLADIDVTEKEFIKFSAQVLKLQFELVAAIDDKQAEAILDEWQDISEMILHWKEAA